MSERPICALCKRNVCRRKGGCRLNGAIKYDYKCSACHKNKLKGNPVPALPRHGAENIARMQLPKYEKRLQRLMKQIGDLRSVVVEYRAIRKKVRRWRERQAYRKARPFWGHEKYRRCKKDHCESCGFVAQHPCQLDVDHIDGNGLNHDPSNLQTLCANCHRLKTQRSGDHLTPRGKVLLPSQGELIN